MNTEYSVVFHKIENADVKIDQERIYNTLKEAFNSIRQKLERNYNTEVRYTRQGKAGTVITSINRVDESVEISVFHIKIL